MRIDLLRHGTTGRDGHLDGRTDPPLSDTGWAQFARQTKDGDWPLVVTSPLARARLAAEDYARRSGSALRIETDWSELDFGEWDGRRRSEIAAEPEHADLLNAFYADPAAFSAPGGERWIALQQRVARALDLLLATGLASALVVTHGGAMRAALADLLGWPLQSLWSLRIDPATRIRLEAGRSADGTRWGEIVEIIQP
ncbi:histidine phosphatase family protein [Bradyrhizobium sp. STM 3557]|uniref:histidine phosphatase family protein n=1 Tax=Bradyrhizobium sp. STM 3557 TaxID=578920 RepID=UPI003890B745